MEEEKVKATVATPREKTEDMVVEEAEELDLATVVEVEVTVETEEEEEENTEEEVL